jgi:hypothetical protein
LPIAGHTLTYVFSCVLFHNSKYTGSTSIIDTQRDAGLTFPYAADRATKISEIHIGPPALTKIMVDHQDDFVAPVKVLLKALDTGIKLSARVSESASSASTTKALQISESAPGLQRSLERNAQAIRDAYRQTVEACGEPFSQALIEDSELIFYHDIAS